MRPQPRITTWHDWPSDVLDALRKWNRNGMSFTRKRQFTCDACGYAYSGVDYGNCAVAVASRVWCDACAIDMARNANELGVPLHKFIDMTGLPFDVWSPIA